MNKRPQSELAIQLQRAWEKDKLIDPFRPAHWYILGKSVFGHRADDNEIVYVAP
jgi:hypothetical protein